MPVKLSMTSRNGHSSEHFKITSLTFDVVSSKGSMTVHLWKDKAARLAGCKSVGRIVLPIGPEEETDANGYKRVIGYSEIPSHTVEQALAKLKQYKLLFQGVELDFTQAVDDD